MNDNSWHDSMLAVLVVAGLAERTQEAYLRAVRQLSRFYDGRCPTQITEQQVKDYLLWMRAEKRAAPGTLKIAIGGLRFFYRQTCARDWTVLDKFRIPKETRLPTVLTIDEVRRIINAIRRERFRAYFWTVYSCGLRLNEALALQVGDVDSQRMRLHVHRGKGPRIDSYRCRLPRSKCCVSTGRRIATRRCCSPGRIRMARPGAARGRRCMNRRCKEHCGVLWLS